MPVDAPSWAKWGKRTGLLLPQPVGRGENGRRFCRWCGTEVPPRSSSWCSIACVKQGLRVLGWKPLRLYVIERDKVCQICGTDNPGKRAWEVDHILRITDGGDDNPQNLRLVCSTCHVAAGYEQRAARSSSEGTDNV